MNNLHNMVCRVEGRGFSRANKRPGILELQPRKSGAGAIGSPL